MSEPTTSVTLHDPTRMNLLGLLMEGLLTDNIDRRRARMARRLKGEVQIQAGRMVSTLRFDAGEVTILAGPSEAPRAWIKGDMDGILGLITTTRPIRPLVSRSVTFGGSPRWLLALSMLMIPEAVLRDRVPGRLHGLLDGGAS